MTNEITVPLMVQLGTSNIRVRKRFYRNCQSRQFFVYIQQGHRGGKI